MSNLFIWPLLYSSEHGVLTVAFLDIGQGDAIYIEAPNGNQVLVDAGSGRQVLRALGAVMPFYDRSLDLLIATHPDADHVGGFAEIIKRYDIGAVMEPGAKSDTQIYQAFRRAVAEKNLQTIYARRGMKIILDKDVTLNILFPDQDPSSWETNTASIVARLVYGENEFLLTGDSPSKIEKYLLGLEGKNLQSDVLKAGHHGSRTSSDPSFVATVAPTYAVISAGKNNRYGHPHAEVLETFKKYNAEILRTAEAGTITFQSDGVNLTKI